MKGVLVDQETDPQGTVVGIVSVVEILEGRKVSADEMVKALLDHQAEMLEQIAIRDRKITELTQSLSLTTLMVAEMERERDAARR